MDIYYDMCYIAAFRNRQDRNKTQTLTTPELIEYWRYLYSDTRRPHNVLVATVAIERAFRLSGDNAIMARGKLLKIKICSELSA